MVNFCKSLVNADLAFDLEYLSLIGGFNSIKINSKYSQILNNLIKV